MPSAPVSAARFAAFPKASSVWGSVATLKPYDVILLSCEGDEYREEKGDEAYKAMAAYTAYTEALRKAGATCKPVRRLFFTHDQYEKQSGRRKRKSALTGAFCSSALDPAINVSLRAVAAGDGTGLDPHERPDHVARTPKRGPNVAWRNPLRTDCESGGADRFKSSISTI